MTNSGKEVDPVVKKTTTAKQPSNAGKKPTAAKVAAKPASTGQPSLDLFPLRLQNEDVDVKELKLPTLSELPPLPALPNPVPVSPPIPRPEIPGATQKKRYVNGRYVISSVARPVVKQKSAREMRWIAGKWVIGLKR